MEHLAQLDMVRSRAILEHCIGASTVPPDVLLRPADGQALHAHSAVLQRSPRLQQLLASADDFTISVPWLTSDQLRVGLLYLYTGQLPTVASPADTEAAAVAAALDGFEGERQAAAAALEAAAMAYAWPARAYTPTTLPPKLLAEVAGKLKLTSMLGTATSRSAPRGKQQQPQQAVLTGYSWVPPPASQALPTEPIVTLRVADGSELPVNRTALCASSAFFAAGLSPRWAGDGGGDGPSVLELPGDVSRGTAEKLVEFVHTDDVDLSDCKADELLELLVLSNYALVWR